MKRLLSLFILLFSSLTYAEEFHDYGKLISYNSFKYHDTISDNVGMTGDTVFYVWSNDLESIQVVKNMWIKVFEKEKNYLSKKYRFENSAPKHLVIRIITLAQLNDPNNFADTDAICMQGPSTQCGNLYLGRTFYSGSFAIVNMYIATTDFGGKYGYIGTLYHETMHFLIYRYGIYNKLSSKSEHNLISRFLDTVFND
jgi:hypothetical protein